MTQYLANTLFKSSCEIARKHASDVVHIITLSRNYVMQEKCAHTRTHPYTHAQAHTHTHTMLVLNLRSGFYSFYIT
jgi:hypothetical protein